MPEPYTTPKGWKPPSLQEQIAHFYRAHGKSKGNLAQKLQHLQLQILTLTRALGLPCRPPVSLGLHRRRPTRPGRLGRLLAQQIITEHGAPRCRV